jgi:hypothetical protein
MERYLLDGERPVIAERQHWAKVAEPVASGCAGLVVAVITVFLVYAVDSSLPSNLDVLLVVLLLPCSYLLVRGALKWVMWRKNWFVATDKRMLLNYGLINVNVAMLSLSKVVDLSYTRSTMGYLLGYGTFVRESAGQNQSLREVGWVKRPEETYAKLCAAIFGLVDQQRGTDTDVQDSEGGPRQQTHNRYAGFPAPAKGPDTTDHSTGPHTRPAEPEQDDSDSWHPDPTLDEAGIHEADTGPIPI